MPGSRVARRSRARSCGVSTSKRDHGDAETSRMLKPAASRARGAPLSAPSPASAPSAATRSPATTNASALNRLLATTSPAVGERSASSVSSATRARAPAPTQPTASTRFPAASSAARAPAAYHLPQWNPPAVASVGMRATAAPCRARRWLSSAARRCRPAASTARYEPNSAASGSAAVPIRTSGAGRSLAVMPPMRRAAHGAARDASGRGRRRTGATPRTTGDGR